MLLSKTKELDEFAPVIGVLEYNYIPKTEVS